ncbi:unnamed protein product [Larinioides sclopetarius]|uniref:Uncharacterized protein n=1 Tax=Larinioides sclopetarius TaxID=280406 RepID=A0AAV1ZAD1_9ARAC
MHVRGLPSPYFKENQISGAYGPSGHGVTAAAPEAAVPGVQRPSGPGQQEPELYEPSKLGGTAAAPLQLELVFKDFMDQDKKDPTDMSTRTWRLSTIGTWCFS